MSRSVDAVPELLAPAGGPSALRAAVSNGADAVYLGVERLNARRGAENFTLQALRAACEFAHLRGVRVYLTANVIVLPREMEGALALIDDAWAAGVDAVIIQDLGLLHEVRERLAHVRVHASTQVNAHSSSTVEALGHMGVSRVTLSRETSVARIAELVATGERAGVEIESFVHGALCVCYSGQCLLSSLIGGRSANRGLCAQPCRMMYELVNAAGEVLATPAAHLLSPKDLAGISEMPALVGTGVTSLKIEGRMKSAEYVAIVTGVYRAALERAVASPDSYAVRDGEWAVLAEAFSRGFTSAYLTEERGNPMMSYQRPNNRGLLVGRITDITDGVARMTLDVALASDDVIEVWTGRGRFAQAVGALDVGGTVRDEALAGSAVRIRLEETASAGDRVFRVRNAGLLRAAVRTYEGEQPAPVDVDVTVRLVLGEPLRVTVSVPEGPSASAEGASVEAARTRAVSAEDVIEHVGRLGGSGFAAREWDVILSPGAGVGFSQLHHVRRDALEALKRVMLEPWAGRESRLSAASPVAGTEGCATGHSTADRPTLVAVVGDLKTAEACLKAGADELHVPAEAIGATLIPGVVPVLPRICPDAQEADALRSVQTGGPAVAGTLGLLAKAHAAGALVQAHWSLNAANAEAVSALAGLGASFVWLSPELSSNQVADIASRAAVPVGIAIAGRQEVMVTEHCVLMAAGECDGACHRCRRRATAHSLRDRKGYEFPVRTDRHGRTHIYNSVPLDLTGARDEVFRTGVSAVRIDLETLSPATAAAEVRRVRAALDAPVADMGKARDRSTTTSGHFFRGVL